MLHDLSTVAQSGIEKQYHTAHTGSGTRDEQGTAHKVPDQSNASR